MKKMEKYLNKVFTKEGWSILYNYTQELILQLSKRKEEEYPFVVGIIYGIPFFDNTNNDRKFNNKKELEGRIIGYMQLLGTNKIIIKRKNTQYIFEL